MMFDDEEEEDDGTWTLDSLLEGGCEPGVYPPKAVVARLVEELAAIWLSEEVEEQDLLRWVLGKYDIELTEWTWDKFTEQHSIQHYRMCKFKEIFDFHHMTSGSVFFLFQKVADVVYMGNEFLLSYGRFFKNVGVEDPSREALVPSDAYLTKKKETGDNSIIIVPTEEDNVILNDPDNNTKFQNLFLYIRKILDLCNFRRANNHFFKRIRTQAGLDTMAFKETCKVEDFCAEQCRHDVNFRAWRLSTDLPSNFANLVSYLQKRPLPEAPDLEENHHLRSFEGDIFGRYSGVYDSTSDFFFPYGEEHKWADMAKDVTQVRRKLFADPNYECKPPPSKDVCICHLNANFPYDIYNEVMSMMHNNGIVWRTADFYECDNTQHKVDLDPAAFDVMLKEWEEQCEEEEEESECGKKWTNVKRTEAVEEALQSMSIWDGGDILEDLKAGTCIFPNAVEGLTSTQYVELSADTVAIPWEEPAMKPRFVLDTAFKDKHFGEDVHRDTYVCGQGRDGSLKYFKPHTGRTWEDCKTKDVDHIYLCQKFGSYDRFFLYALKGRTLFEVGEMDQHQMCLFLEGIGGCGKSTILIIHLSFIPAHLRGVLSSNIQAQFGMSAVAKNGKSRIVVCNEVASDLNLLQEEWQTTVSGEEGSYAVKFEQHPLVIKWKAQHFWIGNVKPLKFKNTQGQVSRRLAGVLMAHAVTPRDGNIKFSMMRQLGPLLRKEVLAYHDFVRFTGGTDPMSQPDKLPPAFKDFYHTGRRMTDPVVDFLSDTKYVKLEEGAIMLMKDFKDLYTRYRLDNDLGKPPRWSEDVYRTPFNERGILVVKNKTNVTIGGAQYRKVDVIYNLAPVADDEDDEMRD